SVRQLFPDKKLTAIFQPHLFTRTRDFAEDFAEALALVDDLLLMEIYPAREEPIEGVDSKWLSGLIALEAKRVLSPEQILETVRREQPELLVTVGAGSIDRLVEPLKNILSHDQSRPNTPLVACRLFRVKCSLISRRLYVNGLGSEKGPRTILYVAACSGSRTGNLY